MRIFRTVLLPAVVVTAIASPSLNAFAQTSVKLFGSTFVRHSTNGTSVSTPTTFNSATVTLTCPATAPATAVLSSTPDGLGNVLADNFIQVTVAAGANKSGPTNVCHGGTSEAGQNGTTQFNCFNATYQGAAQGLVGQSMDAYISTGGVAPINISSLLVQGTQQATIDIVDTGALLTNASLYLVTSCTSSGVTGPASITGNPIPGSNPPNSLLLQDFDFNSNSGQTVGFTYDISTAQQDGQLQITDSTIPTTKDMPLDSALWQSQYAKGTSFATSSCMIHRGELLPNGQSACKLYTLTCQVGTGAAAAGALCPVSQLRDEIFSDKFTGPAFTLPDITGPTGRTYHQGVGLLMAAEGWNGGPCIFDSASGLQASDCPQNLLTFFSSPGAPPAPLAVKSLFAVSSFADIGDDFDEEMDFDGTGTHPNSTFITVSGVPEDLTTVTVFGAHAGGWINKRQFKVGLWSEPPVLPSSLPNHQNFLASPIQSITYGVAPASTVLSTKFAIPGDVTLTNPNGCPAPAHPKFPIASIFAPPSQMVKVQADGQYLLHYFAQDCAGTEELLFSSVGNGGWATSFFSVPVNVDTVLPTMTEPTLSPAPTDHGNSKYEVGTKVTASFSCGDDASGVATCGPVTYSAPGTLNTGVVTVTLDTSKPGSKTYTFCVTDFAGNEGPSVTIKYNVVPAAALKH